MDVHVVSQRKVVEVGWDPSVVHGTHVSIQVEDEEKRNVDNDGKANLTFPNDFSGAVNVTIKGSRSGSQSGTVTVK